MKRSFFLIIVVLVFWGCDNQKSSQSSFQYSKNSKSDQGTVISSGIMEYLFYSDPKFIGYNTKDDKQQEKLLKSFRQRLDEVDVNGVHFSDDMKTFLIYSAENFQERGVLRSTMVALQEFGRNPTDFSKYSYQELMENRKKWKEWITLKDKNGFNID